MKVSENEKIDFHKRNKNISMNSKNKMAGSKKSMKKEPEVKIPKKRGRRPKKIVDSTVQVSKPVNQDDQSAVILKLKINPNDLNMKPKSKKIKKEKSESHSENTDSDAIFNNDIPEDSTCGKCLKLEQHIGKLKTQLDKYEKREKVDKTNKIRGTDLNLIDEKRNKVVIKKTSIKCWWDCEEFDCLPSFLVDALHKTTYHVRGCFCSINCALAYNMFYLRDSKVFERKSLTLKMHREMNGLNIEDSHDIREAGPRECLESFSGEGGLDIEAFRETFVQLKKEYILYMPPIKPLTIFIEERNSDNRNINNKKYTLKRNKPLSKKGSIIKTMGVNVNDGESDDD